MITLFSHHLGRKGHAVSASHPIAVRSLLEPVQLVQRYADTRGSVSRIGEEVVPHRKEGGCSTRGDINLVVDMLNMVADRLF
jgi:hypothetical protein